MDLPIFNEMASGPESGLIGISLNMITSLARLAIISSPTRILDLPTRNNWYRITCQILNRISLLSVIQPVIQNSAQLTGAWLIKRNSKKRVRNWIYFSIRATEDHIVIIHRHSHTRVNLSHTADHRVLIRELIMKPVLQLIMHIL